MRDYIDLLTSLAPNWKVAHIVLGRVSDAERRKPRPMQWCLKVGFRKLLEQEAIALGGGSIHMYRVTSIEVLQSSNEANAKIWTEHEAAPTKMSEAAKQDGANQDSGDGGEAELSELDKCTSVTGRLICVLQP